jgi:hypothetical protein
MQRECNVVAFGELTLSTRLKHKHEIDTRYIRSPKSKMSSKRATLEYVDVEKDLLHKRVSPSQLYFSE